MEGKKAIHRGFSWLLELWHFGGPERKEWIPAWHWFSFLNRRAVTNASTTGFGPGKGVGFWSPESFQALSFGNGFSAYFVLLSSLSLSPKGSYILACPQRSLKDGETHYWKVTVGEFLAVWIPTKPPSLVTVTGSHQGVASEWACFPRTALHPRKSRRFLPAWGAVGPSYCWPSTVPSNANTEEWEESGTLQKKPENLADVCVHL